MACSGGGGGAHTAPPDAGWAKVLIGRRGCRRRRRRAKGWRNRQAPSRGPAAIVSSRRASSERPIAVSTRRKDGHDGWYGRPRAQSRPRVLSSAREKQAAVQRAARAAAIRAQAVAGLLRADLRRLYEALEVPAAAQVSDKDRRGVCVYVHMRVRTRVYEKEENRLGSEIFLSIPILEHTPDGDSVHQIILRVNISKEFANNGLSVKEILFIVFVENCKIRLDFVKRVDFC